MGWKTLQSLRLRNRFGVHVSSILRGSVRINIPNGGTIVFPEDKLQVIGNDEQLTAFSTAVKSELIPEDIHIEEREMSYAVSSSLLRVRLLGKR